MFFMDRSFLGFQMQVAGNASDAARYAGFSAKRMIWIGLLIVSLWRLRQ
jgi:simple sugar transport system permease protein